MEVYEFDHIPALDELMPRSKGKPGCRYLIALTGELTKANKQGWRQMIDLRDGASTFRISTGLGQADCVLMEAGEYIEGAGPDSSLRPLYVSGGTDEALGTKPPGPVVSVPEPPTRTVRPRP